MSACISRHGEFGTHTIDELFTCVLCGEMDEEALLAEVRDLRRRVRELESDGDGEEAER